MAYYIFYVVGIDEFIYPSQQPFKIFGDQDLLNDMVINIESISGKADKTVTIKTAWYKGTSYAFSDKHIAAYIIYVSYQHNVARLYVEHWMYKFDKHHINEIHVISQGNQVYVKYINDESRKDQFLKSPLTVSLDSYFKQHEIVNVSQQQQLKQKFFNLYTKQN